MYITIFIVTIYFINTKQAFCQVILLVINLIIETYHSIIKNTDEGKSCCMVFCDLSKAFNRVWHEGLLFKLHTYGMNGNILQWFKSYLYDRKQKLLYKDVSLNSLETNAGVPQGSVLSPLLFFDLCQ